MNCGLCKKDIGELVVVLPIKQPDGALIVLACYQCASNSNAYCRTHERPHLGFGDGSTACRLCIQASVRSNSSAAEDIYERILADLPAEEFEEIREAAEFCIAITGESIQISVLRFVTTVAYRRGWSIDMVVSHLLREESASVLLYNHEPTH
jgi:hypothetical protein